MSSQVLLAVLYSTVRVSEGEKRKVNERRMKKGRDGWREGREEKGIVDIFL